MIMNNRPTYKGITIFTTEEINAMFNTEQSAQYLQSLSGLHGADKVDLTYVRPIAEADERKTNPVVNGVVIYDNQQLRKKFPNINDRLVYLHELGTIGVGLVEAYELVRQFRADNNIIVEKTVEPSPATVYEFQTPAALFSWLNG